jgi:putrescine aminotransferase
MRTEIDAAALADQDRLHHLHGYTSPTELQRLGPTMIVRGKGVYIYTADGREIIDGMSGGWCTHVGYGDARIAKVAYETMLELSYAHTFGRRSNPWVAALSAKMAEITPAQYEQFFFGSTGSDAVESALKLALYYWHLRGKPAKRAIIGRDFAYHGNTLMAAHLVGLEGYGTQYGFPLTDLFHRIEAPYWYRFGRAQSPEEFGKSAAAALERKILELGPENVAAFIGEPIQATLQLIIPPESYWPEIQRICERHDVLLISDEVVTGMGKTGRMFGFQKFQFEPDLLTLAKGFSSGYFPVSCVGVGSKVGEALQKSDREFVHGFTNCGHPVGAAVALENIGVIESEGLLEKVGAELGPHLSRRLQEFSKFGFVGEVRSMGIVGAIEIDVTRVKPGVLADSVAFAREIGEIAWRKGVHARPIGTTCAMMFPMIITRAQIDRAMDIFAESFAEAAISLGVRIR